MTEDDLKSVQDGLIETSKKLLLEQGHLQPVGFVITRHKHVDKLRDNGWGTEIIGDAPCRDIKDDSSAMLIVDLFMDPKRLYHAVLNLIPKTRDVLPTMIQLGESIGVDAYAHTMRAFLAATEMNEKDIISATIRQICGLVDAYACILHSEAWHRMVDTSDPTAKAAVEKARREGLSGDTKAIEVLFSTMETRTFARTITLPVQREPSQDADKRDAGKVLSFGEPTEAGGMQGRMSGFLKPLENAS